MLITQVQLCMSINIVRTSASYVEGVYMCTITLPGNGKVVEIPSNDVVRHYRNSH